MPEEKNKVTYGLENVHYAVETMDEEGNITYGKPIRYPGAVELGLEPTGDLIEFKADNVNYYVSPNNQGYEGTFNAALVPDHFLRDVLGEVLDEEDQVQTEVADARTKQFALLFQFEGDKNAIRHVMYHCSANRPNVSSSTKDSGEPNTTELTFKGDPRPNDKKVKTKTLENTPKEVYDNWFEKVYEKVTPENPAAVEGA